MTKPNERDDPGIEIAVAAAGGFNQLGKQLGITGAAVTQWTRVPINHVLTIERLYRLNRWELRPDVYPPPQRKRRKG